MTQVAHPSYVRPTSLAAALATLASGPHAVIAGGTDYYPQRLGKPMTEAVLDVTGLPGLRGIEDRGDHWRIGALTNWTDLIEAHLPPCFDGLKLAAREVGGVQIQNSGTLVGNLCNASPAADGTPNLLALDARVELARVDGMRLLPVSEFVRGNRQTLRAADELVTALVIPKPREAAFSGFVKLGARKYLVISIVMIGAVLERAENGRVAAAAIAVGSCSAVPKRLSALESRLIGQPWAPALADCVTAQDLADLTPIDDVRAAASYRTDAALTLLRRLLAGLGETA
jgi:CO/xanthine dehydrogenase FAD-binding subunit